MAKMKTAPVLNPDHEDDMIAPDAVLESVETVVPQIEAVSRSVVIEVPLLEVADNGYISRHVEINNLPPKHAATLKALTRALHEQHAKTAAGRHVDTPTDAIRWLLDQISAA